MQNRRSEKLHAGTGTDRGKIQTRRSGRPAGLENYGKLPAGEKQEITRTIQEN